MKRIVSLLPGATEIICALGLQNQLVGRSHECDFPEDVKKLPAVTKTKINPAETSKAIDKSVNELVKQGLSIFEVDGEKLRELKPDIIITQTQCALCAVPEQEIESAVAEYLDYNPKIISLKTKGLDDIFVDIYKIGEALEVKTNAEILVKKLSSHLEDIRALTHPLANHPVVVCIEWLDPLISAGNWVPEMVEIAGGFPALTNAGERSIGMPYYDLVETDPDYIIIIPCGFSVSQSLAEMNLLKNKPGWNTLQAVRKNKVFIADGNHFFNRPGPRIVQSTEILAEIIHPDIFSFGHAGKDFINIR